MKQLNPGKLYKVNQYFWLLFPTSEAAARVKKITPPELALDAASSATIWASYWSNQLNCNVSFISEGDAIMAVEISGIQVKVINQEGLSGWISFPTGDDENWTEGTITEISSNEP